MDSKNISENYYKIERAIGFIEENSNEDISLDKIAGYMNMSKFHFQKIFSAWVGISPHKFLKYLQHIKSKKLLEQKLNTEETSNELNLTSTSRLYDNFVKIDALSPGEFKRLKSLEIKYGIHSTPFGRCLIGVTHRGICELSFVRDNNQEAIIDMKEKWINAKINKDLIYTKKTIKKIFEPVKTNNEKPISLLVKGTNFQVKVWEALINIPFGQVETYSHIAKLIDSPNSSRAVGSACGRNNIALLIPCHRVINKTLDKFKYKWGEDRKKILLAYEKSLS